MTFESWWEVCQPVVNPNGRAFGIDDTNRMFETYGQDLAEVERVRRIDESSVWTIVETDNGDVLIEGYHVVNRVGDFIAAISHSGEQVEVRVGDSDSN